MFLFSSVLFSFRLENLLSLPILFLFSSVFFHQPFLLDNLLSLIWNYWRRKCFTGHVKFSLIQRSIIILLCKNGRGRRQDGVGGFPTLELYKGSISSCFRSFNNVLIDLLYRSCISAFDLQSLAGSYRRVANDVTCCRYQFFSHFDRQKQMLSLSIFCEKPVFLLST